MSAHTAIDVADVSAQNALAPADTSVDVAFDVAGHELPRDHRKALRDALCACLPWLADDPHAGIHALAAPAAEGASVLLSRRTRIVLRVRAPRERETLALCGRALDVDGHMLRLGAARVKPLAPFPTVGAAFVATTQGDDLAHQHAIEAMLDAIAIARRFICGRLTRVGVGDGELAGASVVVHDLAPADSLRLQRIGLGPHRMLGCGLFVPHKTISGLD